MNTRILMTLTTLFLGMMANVALAADQTNPFLTNTTAHSVVAMDDSEKEGKCGDDKKDGAKKCGEGKDGAKKCGEGKCGDGKKDEAKKCGGDK